MEISETIGLHWTIYGTDRHASGTQIGALEATPAKVLVRQRGRRDSNPQPSDP